MAGSASYHFFPISEFSYEIAYQLFTPAKWTRPILPVLDPNFDPEGQPDPPLFAALRDQPNSTWFTHWAGGFDPIQPYSAKIFSTRKYMVMNKSNPTQSNPDLDPEGQARPTQPISLPGGWVQPKKSGQVCLH